MSVGADLRVFRSKESQAVIKSGLGSLQNIRFRSVFFFSDNSVKPVTTTKNRPDLASSPRSPLVSVLPPLPFLKLVGLL